VRFGIVTTYVKNDGNKETEDLEWSITLADADIREVKVSPRRLQPEATLNGHTWLATWSAKLPHLNQGEVIQATVLTVENAGIKSESLSHTG